MYIRFVTGTESEAARLQHGLITEAKLLRAEDKLEMYEREIVEQIFDWFNEYMPCPPFQEKKWGESAIAWFKDSATDYITKMRELSALLQNHGVNVRVIKTEKPGMILYEDDCQIVSESNEY